MNNKSKPQACSVFGIRGAKVMSFLEMTKQNVIYFILKSIFSSKHSLFQIILVSLQVICGVRCWIGITFVECCIISLIKIYRERKR